MALLRNISLLVLYLAINNLYFVSGDHDDTFSKLLSSKPNDSYCDNFASFVNKLPNISYTDKMALFGILESSAPSGTVELIKVTTPMLKEDFPIVKEKAIVVTRRELTAVSTTTLNSSSESGISKFTLRHTINNKKDPMVELELMINKALFGNDPIEESEHDQLLKAQEAENIGDTLAHFPSGQQMRAELYENKSGVHLPEYMHKGHSYLKITNDYMQTAMNAFTIFLDGTIEDVLRLPPAYVLHSARTISMMKIAREKLVATWTVIKAGRKTNTITHQTLELYRPLFKYVNGREIAKLNLSDERILSYIGTHADLDRHQVGVVASKYIKLNKRWNTAKYLNLMNNLICGVPLLYMRMLGENTYLQLSHQLFYHIRSCDPLQRRFYLHLMTRTQVMGKSNSWSASDVARLGLLLTEVDAPELSAISPKAMSGITAQVMLEMPPQKLKALSETQLKYIAHKPMNILAKKLHKYQDMLLILNCGAKEEFWWILLGLNLFSFYLELDLQDLCLY